MLGRTSSVEEMFLKKTGKLPSLELLLLSVCTNVCVQLFIFYFFGHSYIIYKLNDFVITNLTSNRCWPYNSSIIRERGLRKAGYFHLGSQRQGAGLSGQSLPVAPTQKRNSLWRREALEGHRQPG